MTDVSKVSLYAVGSASLYVTKMSTVAVVSPPLQASRFSLYGVVDTSQPMRLPKKRRVVVTENMVAYAAPDENWLRALPVDVATAGMPQGAWGTRRLVSTYAGPLVRIRDTSTNAEQDVVADADGNLAAFTVTGDAAVVRVYDQSGGDDLVQPVAAKQPLLIPDATPGAHPAIKFDGVDDHLYGATAGATRPYMVSTPMVHIGYGCVAGSKADALIFQVPGDDTEWTADGDASVKALAFGRDGTTNMLKFGKGESFHFNTLADADDGWMTVAASRTNGRVYPGLSVMDGGEDGRKNWNTGGCAYSSTSRIWVGGDEDGTYAWNGYVTELAFYEYSHVAFTDSQWRALEENVRIATMVEKLKGAEWRLSVSGNNAYGNFIFSGAGDISFASLDGAGGSSTKIYGANYSEGFGPEKLLDSNADTFWLSGSSHDENVVFHLQPATPNLPTAFAIRGRGDDADPGDEIVMGQDPLNHPIIHNNSGVGYASDISPQDDYVWLSPKSAVVEYLAKNGRWKTYGTYTFVLSYLEPGPCPVDSAFGIWQREQTEPGYVDKYAHDHRYQQFMMIPNAPGTPD